MAGRPRVLRHWKSKLFSLLLATVVWFGVVGRDIQDESNVEVPIRVISADSVCVLPLAFDTFKADFTGPSGKLDRLRERIKEGQLRAAINLVKEIGPEDIEEGRTKDREWTFSSKDLDLPDDVKLKHAEPPKISISCQRKIERLLKVMPRFFYNDGDEKKDVKIGDPTAGIVGTGREINWDTTYCQPATVKVSGPETVLLKMDHIETEPIDIGGLMALYPAKAKLAQEVKDPELGVVRIYPHPPEDGVSVIITVDPERKERKLKGVPIFYIKPKLFIFSVTIKNDEKNDIQTVDLTVRGAASTVDKLTAKDSDILAGVDLREPFQPNVPRKVPLKITLPKGVELVGKPPNVEVTLSPIEPDKNSGE